MIKAIMGAGCDLGTEADLYQSVHDSWTPSDTVANGFSEKSLSGQACGKDISLDATTRIGATGDQPGDVTYMVEISATP